MKRLVYFIIMYYLVLSVEDVKELITISESFLSKCLFINPHEIVSILQQNNK